MDWFCSFSRMAALCLIGAGPIVAFPCTPQAKADVYIRELNIDTESFGGVELCSSHHDLKKLFNDLDLIENGEFSDRGDQFFIRDFVPAHGYFPWLVEQTRGVERGNDLPWATAYNSGGYFTVQDGWSKLSTAGRVGVLIHEARHSEGHFHVSCLKGPYKNSNVPACDNAVPSGGSHAVEMEYYGRVSERGQNFHPVYQSMARLMLLARANFVFNDEPLSAREVLLARTPAGLVRVGEGERESLVMDWPAENARMKRTSLGLTLLATPDRAWAVDWLRAEPAVAVDDEFSYFKLLHRDPPSPLTDLEEVDVRNQRFIVALTADGGVSTFRFVDGEWNPPQILTGLERFATTAPDGRTGLFGRFKDSTFCELSPATRQCADSPTPWPREAEKFVTYKNGLLRLGPDRKVYDSQGRLWAPLADDEVLDMATVPDYGVFP